MLTIDPPEWTAKELEKSLGMLHETVSGQLRFMVVNGWAEKTDVCRINDTGRKARVYRALPVPTNKVVVTDKIDTTDDRKFKIAVDLDGTLAEYHGMVGKGIGKPIPSMLKRVKRWVSDGHDVIIFTARIGWLYDGTNEQQYADAIEQLSIVGNWLNENGLGGLNITAVKTIDIDEFYDDRAVQVELNTGKIVGYSRRGLC
jgi:hypothetical protein